MELTWMLIDDDGAPITGGAANTALKIRRVTDGYLLDWADLTFKASGWGTLATAMSEVSAANTPGLYKKDVVITSWDDGYYQALSTYAGTPKRAGEQEFYAVDGAVSVASSLTQDDIIEAVWAKAIINKTTGAFTAY